MYTHFWSQEGPGHHGVRLFFVISGFLITGILLRLRNDRARSLGSQLRTFYARRSLRIWPTYYLVLLGAGFLNLDGIRSSMLWHAGYLSNFYYFRADRWDPGVASHLWSLSVEEQFYLIWPFVILLTPVRRLPWVMVAAIVAALAFRASTTLFWASDFAPGILTPASLDALGMGGALALARYARIDPHRVQSWLWAAAAAALVAYLLLNNSSLSWLADVYGDFLLAIVFTSLVAGADEGISGIPGKMLEWTPVVFLGQISYGLYLYHNFVRLIAEKVAYKVGIYATLPQPWQFLAMTGLTIIAATASWFMIERPISGLKRRFPYAFKEKPRTIICEKGAENPQGRLEDC